MKPTLEALARLGHSGTVEEINDFVIRRLGLSQEQVDRVEASTGSSIVTNNLSWARTHLKLAGLIANERRGVWILTQAGLDALALDKSGFGALIGSASGIQASPAPRQPAQNQESGSLSSELASMADTWQSQLLQVLIAMKPDAFERLCQRLLRENGFTRVEVTGRTNDGGIDGIGVLRVNLLSFHVLFQCKKWQNSVGAATVRDFRGAMMGRAEKGVIFTTSSFTAAAQAEATRAGALSIDLIDGTELCRLLKELRLGVRVRQIEDVSLHHEFFETI